MVSRASELGNFCSRNSKGKGSAGLALTLWLYMLSLGEKGSKCYKQCPEIKSGVGHQHLLNLSANVPLTGEISRTLFVSY